MFSDGTLDRIADAGTGIAASMARGFVCESDIEAHYQDRVRIAGGHRFAGLGRMTLLRILREQRAELGVELKHGTDAPPVEELADSLHLHAYPCSGDRSTVIVETGEHIWRELGFDHHHAAEVRAIAASSCSATSR